MIERREDEDQRLPESRRHGSIGEDRSDLHPRTALDGIRILAIHSPFEQTKSAKQPGKGVHHRRIRVRTAIPLFGPNPGEVLNLQGQRFGPDHPSRATGSRLLTFQRFPVGESATDQPNHVRSGGHHEPVSSRRTEARRPVQTAGEANRVPTHGIPQGRTKIQMPHTSGGMNWGGVAIDPARSFFVGDAAGRPGDHSDSDAVFARSVGVTFYDERRFFEQMHPPR